MNGVLETPTQSLWPHIPCNKRKALVICIPAFVPLPESGKHQSEYSGLRMHAILTHEVLN